MFRLVVLVVVLSPFPSRAPAASKVNYCRLNCENRKNPGCDCYNNVNPDRNDDVTENFLNFRTEILEMHNELRNKVGTGTNSTPTASNMNALSYDLELEYLARCAGYRAPSSFFEVDKTDKYDERDECKRSSKFPKYGQTIDNLTYKEGFVEIVESWYIRGIDTIVNPFVKGKSRTDLSNLLWWSHTHVGCARFQSTNESIGLMPFILICNYGGTTVSNVDGMPIYQEGVHCSGCAKGVKCNSQYLGLCGNIAPVPKDAPQRIMPKKKHVQANGTPTFRNYEILFVGVAINLLFY